MADVNDEEVTRGPSPAMLAALDEQWTPHVMAELVDYARRRARLVRLSGRPCPSPIEYAHELVHDAHAATWAGELAWDWQRCPLVVHLRTAIKSRTRHEVESMLRSITVSSEDEPAYDVTNPKSSPNAASAVVFPSLIVRVCDELHEATKQYPACVSILTAWRRNIVEREEVLDWAGLSIA